jgi:hypothetical protein
LLHESKVALQRTVDEKLPHIPKICADPVSAQDEVGYTTKVQVYDFVVGKGFVGAMDDALKQSRWVGSAVRHVIR